MTLKIADREWRARGVENNTSFDLLKVNLRLLHNERFHLDTLDLYQARQRQAFVKQAAEETGLEAELVQRDLAKVLLELEGVRDRRLLGVMQPTEPVPAMTTEEREEALTWLKAPDLIGRLREAFHLAGIIGEETNTLDCVSGGRLAQTGTAAGHHHPERIGGGQDHAHGRGALVLPGGGARQILAR